MKDASTDIIVVSNELLCKEEMVKDFDKHFSRGCNIIEVTSLFLFCTAHKHSAENSVCSIREPTSVTVSIS